MCADLHPYGPGHPARAEGSRQSIAGVVDGSRPGQLHGQVAVGLDLPVNNVPVDEYKKGQKKHFWKHCCPHGADLSVDDVFGRVYAGSFGMQKTLLSNTDRICLSMIYLDVYTWVI